MSSGFTDSPATDLDAACMLADRLIQGDVPDNRPAILKQISAIDWATRSAELFHRFLFAWAEQTKPELIVETGTDRGYSGIHLALGCPSAKVVSIDLRSVCSAHLNAYNLPNVETITADSLTVLDRFADHSIGLLFLDSAHTCEHVSKEIALYVPKVQEGKVVFIDDVAMDGEMGRAWQGVVYPKRAIPGLHTTGFGVFQV